MIDKAIKFLYVAYKLMSSENSKGQWQSMRNQPFPAGFSFSAYQIYMFPILSEKEAMFVLECIFTVRILKCQHLKKNPFISSTAVRKFGMQRF